MRTTAKVDYAVRATVNLARSAGGGLPQAANPRKAHEVAGEEDIPAKFLETILGDLKRGGLVSAQRGAEGGYRLARPAAEIAVADIIRAVEGPLADVRGERPESLDYSDDLACLQRMWVALRVNLRAVLEATTVADLAQGRLPSPVDALADEPHAWHSH